MLRLVLLLAAALAAGGCQRVSPQNCEKICWRFNELSFWERVAEEGKDLPPDGRERLKAARQKEWEAMRKREFDPGLENCIKECRRAARPEDVTCVEKATTAAAAQACLE
ncbi:MAG TPA: hypothetical protein VFU21_12985 [Kofleriaceae bacterium]|nr:hypothetical protein [Kofleriaceae bacterium]